MNSALDRWGGVSPTSSAGGGGGGGLVPSAADDGKNTKKVKKENNDVDDDMKDKKKRKEWAKDSKKKKKQQEQQNQRKNKNKNKKNNTTSFSSSNNSNKDKDKAVMNNVSTTGTDGSGSNSNSNNSNQSSRSRNTIAQTLLRIDTIEAPPPIRNILHGPDNDYEMNDVSTIAGDTLGGDIMDANMAEAVPPMPARPSQSSGPKGEGTIYPMDRYGNIVTNGSSGGGDALQIFLSTPKNKTGDHTIGIDGCDSGSTKPITPEKDDDDSDESDDSDWIPEDYDSDDDDEDEEYDYIYDDDDDDANNDVFDDDVEEYYNNDADAAADDDEKEEMNNNEVAEKIKKKRRKRKKRSINTSIDSDARVLPILGDAASDKKKPNSNPSRRRFKCMLCMGCSLALFLLVGVAVLSYTLYAVRNQKVDDAMSLFKKQFWIDAHNGSHPIFHQTFWKQAGQKLVFWKEFDDEIDDSNNNNETISLPQEDEPITSRNDNNNTATGDELLREKIRSIITTALSHYQRSSSSLYNRPGGNYNAELILQDTTSLQYSIIDWLINDPNINNYSNSKIIQRYALGCFYQNLANNNNENENGNDITNNDVKSTWMSYGDECVTWASTDSLDMNNMNDNRSSNGMCTSLKTRIDNISIGIDTTNGENVNGGIDLVDGKITRQADNADTTKDTIEESGGKIVSIHLENVGLNGTLVPELVLLSDSLESIYLTKNNIRGEIPWTVFSQMTNLKRLQLSRNNFVGTAFPSQEEGLPSKLEILGLGQNNLSGSIPSTLVLPTTLVYLNIPHNQLTGTLPSEIWNNSTLEHISFESNNLTGPIPSQLIMNNLDSLKAVLLSGNDLTGNIPQEVCVEGTIDIAVDCDVVYCSCCAISNCATIFETDSNASTEEGPTFFEVGSGEVVGTNITVSNSTTTTNSNAVTNTTPVSAAASSPSVTPTSAAPTIDPYLYPYIDNATMATMLKEFNSNTATTTASSPLNTIDYSSSSCHGIDVGFSCYDTGYSIDFETSNMCGGDDDVDPLQEYDIIALFPYVVDDDADDDWYNDDDYSSTLSPSELQAVVTATRVAATTITSVGTMRSLNESLYWATSCGLSEGCDGVISSPGKIYYRNMYPTRMISPNDSKLIWPIPVYAGDNSDGSSPLFQLTLVRVNSIGDGIILAESRPFIVSDRCF